VGDAPGAVDAAQAEGGAVPERERAGGAGHLYLMNSSDPPSVLVEEPPGRSLAGTRAGIWPWSRQLADLASEGDVP
jgi:hypothetical protein